ncbi:hypothetical protein [Streptomyces sp. NBC_01445]|uniref:hypothetical protein n=1 Tax=Streptomyces sp. NBC_01445 TaxID=2903869 RepID=UPI002DDAE421|nr:hypothetical protein [Streptomyces sp. NBC_01445]WSE11799.1 hypothetical protein OG574_52555 [Streptomyces sp. NBC_01445]
MHKPARGKASAASAQPAQQEERSTDWAHAAVHESFADAKMRSNQWKSYGFRIAPDVLARLKERLSADRMSSGNRQLAIGHYLDAALRHVSGDVPQWIDRATDFATERLWDSESTQPSSYRVGSVAHAWVSGLSNALQSADFGRKGTLVISAQVELYLDALESEGPLVRPERRRH